MGPQAIIEIQISAEGSPRDADAVVGMQINLLVFDRFPNALDENIVAPGTLAVHADRDLAGDQNAREGFARELAALVGIENPRRPMFRQGLFQRFDTEGGFHRDRDAMAEHPPAEPVDDGGQVNETARHRDR